MIPNPIITSENITLYKDLSKDNLNMMKNPDLPNSYLMRLEVRSQLQQAISSAISLYNDPKQMELLGIIRKKQLYTFINNAIQWLLKHQ